MHLKKISTIAIAALMGLSVISNKAFAQETLEGEYKKILNEKFEKENNKGKKEEKKIPKTVVVLPENEKERKKMLVNEEEELAAESKNEISAWATLTKPEFGIITSKDTVVTGVTSEDTKVMLSISYDGVTETIDLMSDDEGYFGVVVPMGYLPVGAEISAYAYAGEKKSAVATTTVIEGISNAPIVGVVTNYSDRVEGMTDDFHAQAFAEINGKVYECGSVGNDGYFSINIPRQKVGTKISVYTKSASGEKSPVSNTLVYKGYAFDTIDPIRTDSKEVTGKIIPYALVQVRTSSGNVYVKKADKNGNFKIKLGEKLKRGKSVELISFDPNTGVFSEEVVKRVLTAPAAPKVTTKVTVNTTRISGTAGKGFTAYVKIGDKYYKSKVGSDGKFTVQIPKQKYNTNITVYIKGTNGVNSKTVKLKVASSSTAPNQPTLNHEISTATTTISGKGQKGNIARVRIGNKYYSANVAKDGTFKIKIPAQKKDTIIRVYQKNAKGENSTVLVKKVLVAPKAPSDIEFVCYDEGIEMQMCAPKGAFVYAKAEGASKWEKSLVCEYDDETLFMMPEGLKKGKKVTLFAQDANTGARSKVITVKVNKLSNR